MMENLLPAAIAKQFRELYFGTNWTESDMKRHFSEVTWEEANTKIASLNTIGVLAYHIHYYLSSNIRVLKGSPLNASDKESFKSPPITSQKEWQAMLDRMWEEAEELASLIEKLPESQIWDHFVKETYGSHYKNFSGIIEHSYYHLGQVVILKKLIKQEQKSH